MPTAPPSRALTRPAVLLALLAVLLGTIGPAAADGGADWSIAPAPAGEDATRGEGSLAWVLDPGDRIEDAVVVTNNSPTALRLEIAPRDAVTTADGTLDLALGDEPATGIGAWIEIGTPTLDLAAGESAVVPFVLTVPPDALPGDRSGGIATSFAGQGTTVAVTYRLSSRVDVRVPGDLTVSHTIEDVAIDLPSTWSLLTPGTATVHYTLTNTGTARQYVTETVRASGPLGLLARDRTETLAEIVPGASVERTVQVPAWATGPGTVTLTSTSVGVDESAGTVVVAEEGVLAVPWSWVVVLAVLVLLGVTLGVWRGRRRS